MQQIEALLLESFGNFFFKNIFPWTSLMVQLVVFQNKYQNHIFLCVFCHSDLLHFFSYNIVCFCHFTGSISSAHGSFQCITEH